MRSRRDGVAVADTVICYASDQPFDGLDEACDVFMAYLGLEGMAPRAYLRRFLAERVARRNGEFVAPFAKTTAAITWPTA